MFEVPHDNTSKLTCVSNDDSDQVGHPSSQIIVFVVSVDDYNPNLLFCFITNGDY